MCVGSVPNSFRVLVIDGDTAYLHRLQLKYSGLPTIRYDEVFVTP